jgi:hypothetical protein
MVRLSTHVIQFRRMESGWLYPKALASFDFCHLLSGRRFETMNR